MNTNLPPMSSSAPAQADLAIPQPAPTILVVDDEEGIRKYFRQILVDVGYEVLLASNGLTGMAMLRAFEPDLVLMDLVMPEAEGIQSIMDIRREEWQCKIIAISGAFEGNLLGAAKLLGADATLAKPVTSDKLVETVRQLLDEPTVNS